MVAHVFQAAQERGDELEGELVGTKIEAENACIALEVAKRAAKEADAMAADARVERNEALASLEQLRLELEEAQGSSPELEEAHQMLEEKEEEILQLQLDLQADRAKLDRARQVWPLSMRCVAFAVPVRLRPSSSPPPPGH